MILVWNRIPTSLSGLTSERKMKRQTIILGVVALLAACNSENTKTIEMNEQKNEHKVSVTKPDTAPKVTGIGGIFFFCENPKASREWYHHNLGMEVNDYGSTFESRNLNHPEEINSLQWSPFKSGSDYFSPSKKEFMINYRVQNIEAMVKKLKKSGVTVLDTIASYEYGKFVHIMDPDGNKLELWEPAETTSPKP